MPPALPHLTVIGSIHTPLTVKKLSLKMAAGEDKKEEAAGPGREMMGAKRVSRAAAMVEALAWTRKKS